LRRRVATEDGAESASALSEREREVLAMAAMGHHNKLIAYELGLAHSTVRVLLHRAAAKLGAACRRDAIERFQSGGHAPPKIQA
jgi:DNA-binding NarL/FixJ family response regulator